MACPWGLAMGVLPDPLHPAIVHFPIALSLVALLLELLARHPRGRVLETSAGLLMVLAALGSVAAVLSGQAARDDAVAPAGVGPLIERHEEIGELAMWLLLAVAAVRLVLAWRGWFKGIVPWVYLALAAAAAGVVGYNGYLACAGKGATRPAPPGRSARLALAGGLESRGWPCPEVSPARCSCCWSSPARHGRARSSPGWPARSSTTRRRGCSGRTATPT
jgi:uncharacterized membrane protein